MIWMILQTTQAGVFENAELQSLYNQLIAQGSQSLEQALLVGGAIEEIDILDLQERLAQTDQADIQLVFESLLNGSTNHLNAFSSNYSPAERNNLPAAVHVTGCVSIHSQQ